MVANNPLDKLTTKQERAIVALLNEHSVSKAADAAGVGERTLYRWLGETSFNKEYRRSRREAFGQAIALTQRYAPLAVNTLATILMDKDAPHSAKVAACSTMLKFGRDGIELDDLAARIDALEQTSTSGSKRGSWH